MGWTANSGVNAATSGRCHGEDWVERSGIPAPRIFEIFLMGC